MATDREARDAANKLGGGSDAPERRGVASRDNDMVAADSPAASVPYDGPTPEERLESLRFFTAEGQPEQSKSLLDWMQEVEKQIANLRSRLNGLPDEFVQRGPRW